MRRVSSKYDKKLTKIWQNFSHAFEVSKAFNVLIFSKIPCAKEHHVGTLQVQEPQTNRPRTVESWAEIHLHPQVNYYCH
jgi:hypothetical protein